MHSGRWTNQEPRFFRTEPPYKTSERNPSASLLPQAAQVGRIISHTVGRRALRSGARGASVEMGNAMTAMKKAFDDMFGNKEMRVSHPSTRRPSRPIPSPPLPRSVFCTVLSLWVFYVIILFRKSPFTNNLYPSHPFCPTPLVLVWSSTVVFISLGASTNSGKCA